MTYFQTMLVIYFIGFTWGFFIEDYAYLFVALGIAIIANEILKLLYD